MPSRDRRAFAMQQVGGLVPLYAADIPKVVFTHNEVAIYVDVSGSAALFFQTSAVITDFNKMAISYKENDMKFYLNGVLVYSNTSADTFLANSLNTLQLADGNGSANFYGKVKQLQVYDTALTDEQLLQLTGESGTDFYESYAEMASALTYTIQ